MGPGRMPGAGGGQCGQRTALRSLLLSLKPLGHADRAVHSGIGCGPSVCLPPLAAPRRVSHASDGGRPPPHPQATPSLNST
jgi:hypothetical protein